MYTNSSPLEARISRAILKASLRDWINISQSDIVIVGAGPAGLTAGKYLAEKGFRVVIFERRLSFGGGIGGGGMLFHKIVVDEKALPILKDFGIKYEVDEEEKLYVVTAAELMAKLASAAIDAGAKIIHGVHVEDVIIRFSPLRIEGVAIQWNAVVLSGLHVDPMFVYSKAVVDATGHNAEILKIVARKVPQTGLQVFTESSAYAEEGERLVVEKTGRVLPGLYVAGMAVAALHRIPRMGPIFSSMLLSGKRVAEVIAEDLKSL